MYTLIMMMIIMILWRLTSISTYDMFMYDNNTDNNSSNDSTIIAVV